MKRRRKNRHGQSRRARSAPPGFEALEPRLLLSAGLIPCIDLIEADNRGLVVMHVTQDLVAGTVDDQSVQLLGAGADGILGTDDDNVLDATVSYDSDAREIRIEAEVEADAGYAIRVDGDQIQAVNGNFLDAEFNGASVPTGDGVAGGTLLVYTEGVSGNPIARVTTNLGSIDIELFRDQTPLTVANFLFYANEGFYDRSFFHRLVEDFVIQGGGFFAEPGFDMVPDQPPVQNEPGISNLRGTVAMAKIGGDPNSATNEWFFNLADNSANLDNQNGGFTVFAEIVNAEGFAILDLLTVDRDIVNANSINAAFTDVPVLDADDVTNGQITPSDLLRLTRVATLVGLTDTPFESLEVAATTSVVKAGAGVGVRLYALDQGSDADLEGMLHVKFGAGKNIESISIREGASVGRLAIEITGATSVRQLRDLRSGSEDIAFIVSSAHIAQIDMRGSVLGMDINDTVLPGGTALADDIDGDGVLNDLVAIYMPSGFMESMRVRGDLAGDVISPGGARSLRVDGEVRTTEFRLGDSAAPEGLMMTAQFGSVSRTSLFSEVPIRKLHAADWRNTGTVQAPSILDLRTRGGRGLDGDFNASLDLSGPSLAGYGALRKARIAGDINNSTWDIAEKVGRLQVGGDITQWDANISGSIQGLTAKRLQAVSLNVSGEITRGIRATSWDGGVLTTEDGVGLLDLRGDKRLGDDGDLRGVEITINEDGIPSADMKRFRVAGDVEDVEMTARTAFGSIEFGGMMRDSIVQTAGDIGHVQVGDARDSTLSLNGIINNVIVGDWVGDLFMGQARKINIQGGLLGDFFVRQVELMVVEEDVEGQDFRFNRADRVVVKGDVINSRVWFEASQTDESVGAFEIEGTMRDSTFYATEHVGTIMARAILDSSIYIGASAENAPTGFPNEDGDLIDQDVMLEHLVVLGYADTSISFDNTIVAAGRIGTAAISYPEHHSTHAPSYGLAASRFGTVFTRLETGELITVRNPGSPPDPLGAYEIRVGFDAPGVS